MKSLPLTVAAAVILLSTVARADDVDTRNYIYIEGNGEVTAPADFATVEITVSTKANDPEAAVDGNAKTVRAIESQLMVAGIAAADLSTDDIGFEQAFIKPPNAPGYLQPDPDRDKADGFRATNKLTVTIRKLVQLGQVLGDTARASGAISELTFRSSRATALDDQARSLAAADARHRAELFARAMNLKLGPVLSIREGTGYTSDGMQDPANGGAQADLAPMAVSTPQKLRFDASVSVKWEVEPGP